MAISFTWNPFTHKGRKAALQPPAVTPPDQPEPPTEPSHFAEPDAPPSVLHQLNLCNRRLERLLQNLRNEHNAEGEVRDIARDLIAAVALDPDIALACIFLSQIAGSYAVRHCIETAVVGVVVARAAGASEQDVLTVTAAALTMNVGMLRHQETFQNKGALSHEEMSIVRRHPEESADLLQSAGIEDAEWISCVLLHHENDAGTGYPSGIASPQVTRNAKLLSMADRYCAQVAARNYRCSLLPDRALHSLLNDPHIPADPDLATLFQRELGNYPPGTLVRLQDGALGVVTQRGHGPALPVHCLRDADGATVAASTARRTTDDDYAIASAVSEDQIGLRFSMKQIWGQLASL
jgi:HD-GYP domain-containing protein (c-di-GMP phosphodiesterase class II)